MSLLSLNNNVHFRPIIKFAQTQLHIYYTQTMCTCLAEPKLQPIVLTISIMLRQCLCIRNSKIRLLLNTTICLSTNERTRPAIYKPLVLYSLLSQLLPRRIKDKMWLQDRRWVARNKFIFSFFSFLFCVVLYNCADPETLSGVNGGIVPFLACGDLSGFDSDMTYPVEVCSFPFGWLPTTL